MDAIVLFERLTEAGVSVWLDAGALKYRAPAGALGDGLRDAVSDGRVGLMALLKVGGLPGELEAWDVRRREDFEERAAIIEHGGGLLRAVAELFAEARVRLGAARAVPGPD